LFRKWIIPEILTKDQICDQMVLEQFLGMLNTDLQVWVREHTPRSSAEAADLGETFVTARPSRRKYFLVKRPSENPFPGSHKPRPSPLSWPTSSSRSSGETYASDSAPSPGGVGFSLPQQQLQQQHRQQQQ
jgi:hypothetical protein